MVRTASSAWWKFPVFQELSLCGVLLLFPPTIAMGAEGDAEPASESGFEMEPDESAAALAGVEELGTLVVTPGRSEGDILEEPYAVNVIDSDEIEGYNHRTVPDSMSLVPSVMVQKTSLGQGSPYIRGFTGYRNLFLMDGFRLNNSVFRDGPNQYWNTVNPYSVDRLEIVRGPGSVLYGSDAIGGTVNTLTHSPLDMEGDEVNGRILYRGATAERSTTGRGEFYGKFQEKVGYFLGITGKDFGDLEGGSDVGRQEETGYEEYDGDGKLQFQIDPDTRLTATFQKVRQNNVPRTHQTIHAIDWEDLSVGTELQRDLDQERDFASLKLEREDLTRFIQKGTVGVSWHEQTEVQHRIRKNGQDYQGFCVGQVGALAEFESETAVGNLVYGIDYYHDNVNSFNSTNPIQGPVADDAEYDLLGIYLQDTIPLVDETLDLILGGRYDYAAAEADKVQDPDTRQRTSLDEDWDAVVGSARLMWHIDSDRHWHTFVGVSQGFRAPNLSDLTRFDTARTNEFEVASTDLDPEYFVTYEAGIKAEYEKVSLELDYYYTDINEMIIRYPTGRLVEDRYEITKDNAGDGYVHGVELQGSYRFLPAWTVLAGGSLMYGAVDTYPTSEPVLKSEPIDRMMPPTGHAGLRWDSQTRKLWIQGLLEVAGEADDLSTASKRDTSRIPPGGTPGYEVVSLYAGWEPVDSIEVTLALENIFDEDYRIHGSGVNEPGINAIGQVAFKF